MSVCTLDSPLYCASSLEVALDGDDPADVRWRIDYSVHANSFHHSSVVISPGRIGSSSQSSWHYTYVCCAAVYSASIFLQRFSSG
jgi:hypothetical protein